VFRDALAALASQHNLDGGSIRRLYRARTSDAFRIPKLFHRASSMTDAGADADDAAPPTPAPDVRQIYVATRPLKFDWRAAMYTDGSKIDEPKQAIGAGVYFADAPTPLSHAVDAGGHGATNTINRAELAAIYHALREAGDRTEVTLFTDSLASIYQIRAAIMNPMRQILNKHNLLLQSIVALLSERASHGWATTILKVKSHFSCFGNDEADTAARQAAAIKANDGTEFDAAVSQGADPYRHLYWPATKPPPPAGQAHDGPAASVAGAANGQLLQPATGRPYYISNLTSAIRGAAERHYGTKGAADAAPGLYQRLWDALVPNISSKFMLQLDSLPTVSTTTRLMLFKARWGLIFNMKLAQRYRIAGPTPHYRRGTCPLCSAPDSVGHILGSCTHAQLKARYMQRHNDAVRIIQRYVAKGSLGGAFTVMDAGRAGDLPPDVNATRVSSWLLQNAPASSRPDILSVQGVPYTGVADVHTLDKSRCTVHVAEIGYTSDLRYEEKYRDKLEQHSALLERLQAAGWPTVHHVLILGSCGTVYNTTVTSLQRMGITGTHLDRCISKLSTHTATAVQSIVVARRRLERGGGDPRGIG
jgi:ribonuclease HI